jgi:hypothetical protein
MKKNKNLMDLAVAMGVKTAGEFGLFLRYVRAGMVSPNLTGKSTVLDLIV